MQGTKTTNIDMINSYLIVEMCDFDGWEGWRSRKKILGLRRWPRDFLFWAMGLVGYFFFTIVLQNFSGLN